MPSPELLRLLVLGRQIAFLIVLYLIFGWIVERATRDPESKVRGFARLICSPLTRPVAILLGETSPYSQVLRLTLAAGVVLWLTLVATSLLVQAG